MNQAMQFDHIVVDEAGYAPLAKVIPLMLMHCPISLLGDLPLLPPPQGPPAAAPPQQTGNRPQVGVHPVEGGAHFRLTSHIDNTSNQQPERRLPHRGRLFHFHPRKPQPTKPNIIMNSTNTTSTPHPHHSLTPCAAGESWSPPLSVTGAGARSSAPKISGSIPHTFPTGSSSLVTNGSSLATCSRLSP